MYGLRRRYLPIALALVAVSACQPVGEGLAPDVRRGIERGNHAAEMWIEAGHAQPPVPDETVIALGYLERLRLGLGSPFRLTEYALADPRLADSTRADLGWALLARTLDRASYEVDPAALDRATPLLRGTRPGIGRQHLELIENAIRESRDPRSGELAVRLAYGLAAAEGSLAPVAPDIATKVAALVRDRELARADALRLLRTAAETRQDPLRLLVSWRAERRFEVEQPPLTGLSSDAELTALELAPRLERALRELSLRFAEPNAATAPTLAASASLLTPEVAHQLDALADSLNAPPQTPVTIAARLYREQLVDVPWLNEAERQRRTHFVEHATSEERFAAEYALLGRRSPYDAAPALAALSAATALRTYAQEQVWYPGYGGPRTRELEERYGLADVRFGDRVPADWRPYYRRMLDVALADLYRVLPSLDLTGLTVVFDDEGSSHHTTLAMHDPSGRRLLLPPATAAGTLAHEVAHDLDWQVALRRYHVRGDYASDRAARTQRGALAAHINDLAAASLEPVSEDEKFSAHARRPAEVFARNVDWFVAVSLAAQGRVDGYLSSVQDDRLTGYGTVRPPDITGAAGTALIDILDDIAPLYPGTREWYLKRYGLKRALTPYDLVRGVLEADLPGEPLAVGDTADTTSLSMMAARAADRTFSALEQARDAGFSAIDAWICRSPGAAYHRELESARRALVVGAASARARGVALQLARELAGRAGRASVARELYGAQWPRPQADSALVAMLLPLAERARDVGQADVSGPAQRFDLTSPPERCAGAPLQFGGPIPLAR